MRISDWSSDVCSSDLVHELRRLHLLIACGVQFAAHILFQLAPQHIALGVPENGTLCFLLQVEQVHLRADLTMIPLRRFLKPRQLRLKLFLVEPARAVNPGQHRILRSEERRVGKESVSTCSDRGSRYHKKKKK